ncbi:hypothetical protein TVNIR_1615 [Thioalkalivibrio nitratireducens DSM 14787]|uniref:Uncharacterized protein n=1 Tax=Thioalkalivibrio nitratireducens (strain DSM 14787 / UNIQEM 213 / ALEN2) TaxID=1255043 RepID=L0DY23_THIND|nr:hypothetical protein [Thioalkalivibrio nitratireducens]AGA33281.1 hypothetical protein TVNIR_1615 [Thioalkalivibrio nitratireducens DSM 14787]
MRSLFLSVLLALAAVIASAAQAEPVVRVNLASEEISAVAMDGHQVWLRLRPTAVSRLQAIAQQHQGELLELTVAGHQALKFRINEPVGSVGIQINDPDPVLRQELLALQHQLLQGDGSR